MGIRIVVTGGRDLTDRRAVFAALDYLLSVRPVVRLAHGGARGADTLAGEWAKARGIECVVYPVTAADWKAYGPAAGPRRNCAMLDAEKPDGLVTFPGGRGTADCIKAAEERGVKVWAASIVVRHLGWGSAPEPRV